jgi:2-polyprenyl-6-methoxyphenol hydroxylase-like FAD-dependent oxidoreductase
MQNGSILIVGAGPTGLAMAIALARQGVQARIIDKSPEPSKFSKALGIQARTLELFDQCGCVDAFLAEGVKLEGLTMAGTGHETLLELSFAGLPSRYPYILSVPQDHTEQHLIDHLGSFGIAVDRQVELVSLTESDDKAVCTLSHRDGSKSEESFEWVIGCDGAHSTVRSSAGIDFEGHEFPQQFMLADVNMEWDVSSNQAHLFAEPEGLLALFPMPGGRVRVIASNPADSSNTTPTLEDCQKLIAKRASPDWKVTDLHWSSVFRIHSRHVHTLRKGCLLLAGDAAHIHSPAMAQGMNTGIQDAFNLGWKLALVVKGIAEPDLIDSYQDERMPVIKKVLTETGYAINAAGSVSPVTIWLREHVAPIFAKLGPVQTSLTHFVSELSIDYTQSELSIDHGSHHGPRAGERIPDYDLQREGKTVRLYELFREPGHHLVIVDGTDGIAVDDVEDVSSFCADEMPGEVNIHVVRHSDARADLITSNVLVFDVKGDFHDAFGDGPSIFLIRPDGYVGVKTRWEAREEALGAYFQELEISS